MLDVIKSVRVLLDTKGLKRNIRIFTRIFAEILIGGSEKKPRLSAF